MELTYTKEADVRERRKKALQFKQRLLYQLQNLKAIEHKVHLEEKVERWIDENIETLTNTQINRKRPKSEKVSKSQSELEYLKRKSQETFIKEAERLIRSRSSRSRSKRIDSLRNKTLSQTYE